jgi:hypothetical protein
VAWWLTPNVFTLGSFQATPWTVCKLVNSSSNLRRTSICQREKMCKMCLILEIIIIIIIIWKTWCISWLQTVLHADYLLSYAMKLLGLIRKTTFSISSLDTSLILHMSLVERNLSILLLSGIFVAAPIPTTRTCPENVFFLKLKQIIIRNGNSCSYVLDNLKLHTSFERQRYFGKLFRRNVYNFFYCLSLTFTSCTYQSPR